MHVEKEKMREKEKLFVHFVPKFDKVCADAKAPPDLMELLGEAVAARGKSSTAGTRRGEGKGR